MTNESVKEYCFKHQLFEEINFLDRLVEIIIPEDVSRGLPSLKHIGFAENAKVDVFFIELLKVLQDFIKEKGTDSKSINPELFKKEKFKYFHELSIRGINAYYVSEEVLSMLKLFSVPPFPNGNIVPEGDLLLLEPVYLRGKKYREI